MDLGRGVFIISLTSADRMEGLVSVCLLLFNGIEKDRGALHCSLSNLALFG